MTVYDASRISAEAYRRAKADADALVVGMTKSAGELYAQACAEARALHATMGEKAVGEAVRRLSENGVYAYSYTRSDGTLVRVPCDVGIRRVVGQSGKQARNAQVLGIAAENGMDLIEVSSTPNCRDSHQIIDGGIFSLSGENPRYPQWTDDLEALLDEPNCQHQIAIYSEGGGSRFSSTIGDAVDDALPGGWTLDDAAEAGAYTSAQVAALRTRQRALENDVRKAKRSQEVLRTTGHDASKATARLNAARAGLRELTSKHEKVLVREHHREQVYDSARRMRAKAEKAAAKQTQLSGTKAGGAVRGALNDTNDPYLVRREAHAKRYYEGVRNRDRALEVASIAEHSGVGPETVSKAYDHLFINEHDLEGGRSRFDPMYEIAESWRRLREGTAIQEHDLVLLKHEALEHDLMAEGMSYKEAHEIAQERYNYAEALKRFEEGG